MEKKSFPKGIHKYTFITDKESGSSLECTAEYIGRNKESECIICGCGNNCYAFNVFDNGEYVCTISYGREHLSFVVVRS